MPYCPFRTCNQQRFFDTDEALSQHARSSRKVHPCCVPCERVFVDTSAYSQHRESVHTFPCAKCNTKYRSEAGLQQHYQTSKAHVKCNRCGEGFYNRYNLNSHMASEHPTICEKSFLSLEELDRHNREPAIHPKCQYCGGLFKDASAIIEHITSEHFLEHMKASSATIAAALESSSTTLRPKSVSDPNMSRSVAVWSKLPPLSAACETQPPPFALPPVRPAISLVSASSTRFWQPTTEIPGTPTTISSLTSPPSVSSEDETIFPTSESDFGSETDGGEEMASRPSGFSLAFNPTIRPAFLRASASNTSRDSTVNDSNGSSTTLGGETIRPEPPKTITPSLLAEPLFRIPSCPDYSTQPNVQTSDFPCPSPLRPSNSKAKVPLAETPGSSGDLPNFDLITGPNAGEPVEDNASAQSLSPPETPIAIIRDMAAAVAQSPPKEVVPVPRVSFHCRICQVDPCQDITATVCGHLFCNRYECVFLLQSPKHPLTPAMNAVSCITEEVRRNARCPMCQAVILLFTLLRLDASVT
ncbi:hypothetical protein EVG20_g11159 [Dentipellis fragilis]|uniref:C2H2-type domain-containing protein n=1 Tax=Dentipellis fragilis TaxID=205917 RepID=A0A4Y9XMY2_9AGAM|nr:hypothetical protein EVG20_g11159 [Dentipellis fragilis]